MIKDIIQSVLMGAVFSVRYGLSALGIIGMIVLIIYGLGMLAYVTIFCELPYCLYE